MFERKKELLSSIVQAGLFLAVSGLLSACGEQTAPVDTQPSRVAAASPSSQSELPEIVVTASRKSESET